MNDVDAYIADQSPEAREHFESLRRIILGMASDAEEQITYKARCFEKDGMLIGMGVSNNTVSFYTISPNLVATLKEKLEGLKESGATLYPPGERRLTSPLSKVVSARVVENAENRGSKGAKWYSLGKSPLIQGQLRSGIHECCR